MSDRVTINVVDGVADVRLNRPDKMNALDPAMFRALREAGETLRGDPSVRAAVLSGEGRAFCSGLDVASFGALSETVGSESASGESFFARSDESPANAAQSTAYVWNELPIPVIAAVHGVAFGGGFQIAMGADIRCVTPDARLSVMEIKWGLIPDMSGTQTLRHLVRADVAKELTFTGREVSGEEALELGLATHVDAAPRERAFDLALQIAQKSPDAIRAAKRLFNQGWDGNVATGLQMEEDEQRALIGSPNQIEAVQSTLERRDAKFRNPGER